MVKGTALLITFGLAIDPRLRLRADASHDDRWPALGDIKSCSLHQSLE